MLHQHTKKIIAAVCSLMMLFSTLVSAQTIPAQEDVQQTSSDEIRTMSDQTQRLSAGGSFANATLLTPTGNPPFVSTSDELTKVGDEHYYKIKSSIPYDVSFYLGNFPTNQTYDLDVYIEHNLDDPLVSGKLASNGRATMTSLVIAANVTYYIKVSGDRPETSSPSYDGYLLELDYVAADEYEPNDGKVGWAEDWTDITLKKKETKVISATLHDSQDVDVFELTLSEACDVAVTLQSPAGKSYAVQFDGEQIQSGQTKSFTASAGESHRMIVHNGGSGGSVNATYTLTIATKAVNNNTEKTARAVPLNQAQNPIKTTAYAMLHLSADDSVKYFKVSFTQPALAKFFLDKPADTEEYEMVVYNSSKTYSLVNNGSLNPTIRLQVDTGDAFFIKVTSKSGKYDVADISSSVSVTAYNFNGNQNNANKAHAIDMSSDLKTTNTYELDATIFGDWIGFENQYEQDWFKLTYDKNADLNLNLSCPYSSKNQYTVTLYDATGTTALKTAERPIGDRKATADLSYSIEANKTYYVCVTSNEIGEFEEEYTLKATVTPAVTPTVTPDANEPNDTLAQATDTSRELNKNPSYQYGSYSTTGNFHSSTDQDWYKIKYNKNATITFSIRNITGKTAMSLYDANGTPLQLNADKKITVNAGDIYYICLEPDSTSDYYAEYDFDVRADMLNNEMQYAYFCDVYGPGDWEIFSPGWYYVNYSGTLSSDTKTYLYLGDEVYDKYGNRCEVKQGRTFITPNKSYYFYVEYADTQDHVVGLNSFFCDSTEPNDTLEEAYSLGTVSFTNYRGFDSSITNGYTATQSDQDFYRVEVGESGNVKFRIDGIPDYADTSEIAVYDHQGTLLTSSTIDQSGEVIVSAQKGNILYFKITSDDAGNFSYHLGVSMVSGTDYSIFDNTFEDGDSSAWKDTTGRGAKAIKQEESGNSYLEMTCTGNQYYNFRCLDKNISGKIVFETDIKFTENDMELQMRDVINNGAQGFTMAARIKKYAYYIQYFSDGSYQKLLTPSGSWLQLKDVSKWYTLKMELDTDSNTQSIYLSERDTGTVVGLAENIPLNSPVHKINSVALSSTDTLCIDNARLTLPSSF